MVYNLDSLSGANAKDLVPVLVLDGVRSQKEVDTISIKLSKRIAVYSQSNNAVYSTVNDGVHPRIDLTCHGQSRDRIRGMKVGGGIAPLPITGCKSGHGLVVLNIDLGSKEETKTVEMMPGQYSMMYEKKPGNRRVVSLHGLALLHGMSLSMTSEMLALLYCWLPAVGFSVDAELTAEDIADGTIVWVKNVEVNQRHMS